MDPRANGAGSEGEEPALARQFFAWQYRPADDPLELARIGPLYARQFHNPAGAAFGKMFDNVSHSVPSAIARAARRMTMMIRRGQLRRRCERLRPGLSMVEKT
jgi:hypothetical protein